MKQPRPRIKSKVIMATTIVDPIAYTQNSCSVLSRHLCEYDYHFKANYHTIEHYDLRVQNGDENGKREGIGYKEVEELIDKSFKHIIAYSFKIESFINFPPSLKFRAKRVVLQEEQADGEKLNVTVEYHYVDNHTFEIAIITAMKINDFRIGDGNFVLEIVSEGSVLYKLIKGNLNKIDEIIE